MKSTAHLLVFFLAITLFYSCTTPAKKAQPPVAEKIEEQLIMHGDTRIDFYYWMRDRENPAVIDYLNAENEYLKTVMSHTEALQQKLYDEMLGRIKQDESSAPWFHNGYYYYTRYEEGGEYPIYCRRKGNMDAPEVILLNVPQMAEGYNYYRIGNYDISPDNRQIAYTVDTIGRRQHTIFIKDLETSETRPTYAEFAAGDVVWAADNQTIFYTVLDPITLRYERILRYNTLGQEAAEEVYYEEDDTYYYMGVSKTKDGKYLTISMSSSASNETLILESDNPDGRFRVFEPRQKDRLYVIEHYKGKFYVITNKDAQNFRLMETPAERTGSRNWSEVIPHREDVLLEGMSVFSNHLVLQERRNGLREMRIIRQNDGNEHYISFEEEAYTAGIHINEEMDTDIFRFSYTSLTTPSTIYDYNMNTREQSQIWQQTVLGDFDPADYETRRLYAPARDGEQIPITIVYRRNLDPTGNNPLLQYGYGSYGFSVDPRFNSNAISLIDRGFIYAMAHIRGGQDMGRQWYDDGKLLNKRNTFYDFIDVSEYLIANNYTSPGKLFASGGSAGGLLVGAVINMRPELYKGIIASVPFVDVVTTMLDETIPLTTAEYDEWGNPNIKEYYDYMLSYSPYDQITRQGYPNLLITSGLHDSQVQFWEPTKWTAKLRKYNTADTKILLTTNMEAGHGGASGRLRRLQEVALQYAFLLDLIE
ncbi:MAG: S9 family peptidase [Bacteroidales bacterium]|nr:S9 family peptidase [Bacteroidales bacterium]